MSSVSYMGKDITLDSEGFLSSGEDWNEEIARKIAAKEGLDHLNKEQLEIIVSMRAYYFKYKVFPILNNVCKIAH